MPASSAQYAPIPRRSISLERWDEKDLASDEDETALLQFEQRRRRTSLFWHWIGHLASLVALLVVGSLYLQERLFVDRTACWSEYNYYSPVNSAHAAHPYVTTQFNGSLWYDSEYKGPPTLGPDSPSERAWQALLEAGIIAVSAEDLERTQHNLTTAAQFPPEANGGASGGYVATTVGQHQLHCLHYLWQDHHQAYFPETQRKAAANQDMYDRHFEHCVDYIRQSLMCSFDLGLVTYDWVLDHDNPTPNSNAWHKCVDWDLLQDWMHDHEVATPDGFTWKQPEGQVSLPWNP